MSDDLKKHIQLVESQLNENPLSTAMRAAARLGQGSKKQLELCQIQRTTLFQAAVR
mgnify:CR=1 FL=1